MKIPRAVFICPHGPAKRLKIFKGHAPVHSWPQWANVLPDCWLAFGSEFTHAVAEELASRELFVVIGGAQALHVLRELRGRFPGRPVAAWQDANTQLQLSMEAGAGTLEVLRRVMEFYRSADAILSATRNARSFYELFNPIVRYVGLPYPEKYLELALPAEERQERTVAIGGVYRAGRGLLLGLLVAQRLGYRVICCGDRGGAVAGVCEALGLESERIPLSGQVNYLKRIAKARVALYLEQHGSVGRFVRDCAALRIPCLASDRTDFGRGVGSDSEWRLWSVANPDYHVDVVCERLRWMEEHWPVLAEAQRALLVREFGSERSRQRFAEALDWL